MRRDADYRGGPRHANAAHNIIPDIAPYQSMVDGSQITSRSKHREHLRQHGMIEMATKRITKSRSGITRRPPA